jgi:hypothetical protein
LTLPPMSIVERQVIWRGPGDEVFLPKTVLSYFEFSSNTG